MRQKQLMYRKAIKRITTSPLLILTLMVYFSSTSYASIITSNSNLPPIDGEYVSERSITFSTATNSIILSELAIGDFASIFWSTSGSDEIQEFVTTLSGTGSIDSGTPDSILLAGPALTIAFGKAGMTTGTFNTEIIAMELSGEISSLPILIRESPTFASSGQTAITDIGGGLYQIDSFFDIFMEISLDGGNSWAASDSSTIFVLQPLASTIPVPAAIWLFGSGLLGLIGIARRKKA